MGSSAPASWREAPPITVVIPTLNRPVLLARTLRAIIAQDYPGTIECIIVFDRPQLGQVPDLTLPLGRSVSAVTNSRTTGLAGARNTGLSAASTELVALCDDDDEWLPSKLSRQVSALAQSPAHCAATCGIVLVSEGRERVRILPQPEISHEMFLRSRLPEVHSSTLLIRRSAIRDHIGLFDENLPGSYAEDYEWLLRATRHAPVLVAPLPLVRIAIHARSHFNQDWPAMSSGCRYLLEHHPDLLSQKLGLSRIYGRVSIAEAAMGNRKAAMTYAAKTLKLHPRQHRAYVGLAIVIRLLTPEQAIRLAGVVGRGI